jgi:hypothetical protein
LPNLASKAEAQTFEGTIEGQAILIEVTQSVSVAALRQDVAEQETDITASTPSIVTAAAPVAAPQGSIVILNPEE